MSRQGYALLWLLGFVLALGVAALQPFPGYLDAAYYFGGGLQLVRGQGFSEPYIWTYLDDPAGLPHPSHGYWMPLASILSAVGMWLTGQQTFAAARLCFILLASLLPPLTARLAFAFSGERALAWMAGFLALCSGYYASFLTTTDNFSPYMVLGALFFLLLGRSGAAMGRFFLLGIVAGLLNLARSDGLLWLVIALLAAFRIGQEGSSFGSRRCAPLGREAAIVAGFLLIMGPWYLRNLRVYGAFFSPATQRALWLRSYNETFIYPPELLTPQHLLESGWQAILAARLWALWQNAQTAFAVQGLILLFPLILIGLWKYRRDGRVQLGVLAWGAMYLTLSLVFPFAGARGGFFHAGATLQPLWFALAAVGFDALLRWAARRRGWYLSEAQRVFRPALILFLALLTGYLTWGRVIRSGWGEGEQVYPAVERLLVENNAPAQAAILVLNPPAYFIMTGRPAVVHPYADETTLLEIARRYGVRYLALEPDAVVLPFYQAIPNSPHFRHLGAIGAIRLFEILP